MPCRHADVSGTTRARSLRAMVLAVGIAAAGQPALARAEAQAPAPAAAPAAAAATAVAPAAATSGAGSTLLTFFPAAGAAGEERWSIGGVWQVSPMFAADYRRGLGSGFSLDARAQTILVYNQLGVGASWAASAGPFQLGLMGHVDGYFGKLGGVLSDSDVSGFDSTGWGILLEPGAMAGLQVAPDAWLTLILEVYLQPYQAQKLGSLVISPPSPTYSGGRASLVVEHSVGSGVVYYGATVYHTTQNFPFWFNVNYNSAKSFYLGFLAGYEF